MAVGKRNGGSKRRGTKDRVLQARIPQKLDDELRDRAEQLGLSVSTIVRNTLLHTFDLVEGVVTDSAQLSRVLRAGGAPAVPPSSRASPDSESGMTDEEPVVIGWQEAILNINGICDSCNTILPRGVRAAVGMPVQRRPVLLCLECLQDLRSPPREGACREPHAEAPENSHDQG